MPAEMTEAMAPALSAPAPGRTAPPLTGREVMATWWPLAASWLLMGLELPLVSAVLARLAHPTLSLAAYGGVVFPIALLIESPIVMMLSASTALARDRAAYRLVRRAMLGTAGALTVFHAAIAFTGAFDAWVVPAFGIPPDLREPVRLGLRIMLPWTLSIATRRFHQGVLIRFGRSWAVGTGTLVRLVANVVVLGVGAAIGGAGYVIGPIAVAAGVVSEAAFAALVVRPVLRRDLPERDPAAGALTFGGFLHFYLPLAAMPLLAFFAMPLASAAMTRMPRALESLAAWPVLNGLGFLLRSTGFAVNEVVIARVDRPNAIPVLRRFCGGLAAVTSLVLVVMAVTPLGTVWFEQVSALSSPLGALASAGLWLALPWPALSVYQSWYQGAIVHSRRTRAVTESVALSLAASALVLGGGIVLQRLPGLPLAMGALVLGNAVQVAWLARNGRPLIRVLEGGSAVPGATQSVEV